MLYVKYAKKTYDVELQWHVGNKPVLDQLEGDTEGVLNHVVEVYADGDELDYIRSTFDRLPIKVGRTCVWHGEMAKFIVVNLGNP